jgi:hypothetical protein
MVKILCINYSQSGQLHDIIENFISPLEEVQIDRVKITIKDKFQFPWRVNNFYDIMPETVLEEPIDIDAFELKEDKYDLIILGYQPWFLSPSMPTSTLLQNEEFKKRLKDTPVITILGARNMWLNSQQSVTDRITSAGGKMIGNIALVDRAPNHASAVSITHWMLTGKKTRKWGIFPLPGVSDKDIKDVSKFGVILNRFLKKGDYSGLQAEFVKEGAVRINSNILFIEGKAKKIFMIWAKLIKKKEAAGKNRSFWVKFFRIYLNVALFVVAPILLFFDILLIRPFKMKEINAKKSHYTYLGIN